MLLRCISLIGTTVGNVFILVAGIICFIFDAAYIYCPHHVIRKVEKA